MSAFKNFVEDFPQRCREVLHLAERSGQGKMRERDVTLMLMVAAAGLVVPYERLKADPQRDSVRIPHPSRDNETFIDAACQLAIHLGKPFLNSDALGQPNASWRCGRVPSAEGEPDLWQGFLERRPFTDKLTVRDVLSVIRNGLAHGSIATFNNPIEEIIFLNVDLRRGDYTFVSVGPTDFRRFLEQWFDFLADLHIPYGEAVKVLREAA